MTFCYTLSVDHTGYISCVCLSSNISDCSTPRSLFLYIFLILFFLKTHKDRQLFLQSYIIKFLAMPPLDGQCCTEMLVEMGQLCPLGVAGTKFIRFFLLLPAKFKTQLGEGECLPSLFWRLGRTSCVTWSARLLPPWRPWRRK